MTGREMNMIKRLSYASARLVYALIDWVEHTTRRWSTDYRRLSINLRDRLAVAEDRVEELQRRLGPNNPYSYSWHKELTSAEADDIESWLDQYDGSRFKWSRRDQYLSRTLPLTLVNFWTADKQLAVLFKMTFGGT